MKCEHDSGTRFAIVEADTQGQPIEDEGHRFYLNHAYLGSMAFGSQDMAWSTSSRLEAEGMAARLAAHPKSRNASIVEL